MPTSASTRWLAPLGLLLGTLLALPARAATEEGAAGLSIGVAPFEQVAPAGASVPDAARLLADRLGTQGVGRVVGPAALGGPATADPSREQVQAWGRGAEVRHVVVGRSTRIGRRLSLDLRLRRAESGEVVSTYVAEAARDDELEAAIDRLAEQIVAGALGKVAPAPVAAGRQVASAAGVVGVAGSGAEAAAGGGSAAPSGSGGETAAGSSDAGAPAPEKPAEQHDASGFFGLKDSGAPISIRSDELEAVQNGGERRFLFRRKVRVEQGKMNLSSDSLEAFYPDEASQPERLIATGHVVIRQTDQPAGKEKSAHCERATYLRTEKKVICVGTPAELRQGKDRVRGSEIEFFLDTERLIVRGGADVRIKSEGEGS